MKQNQVLLLGGFGVLAYFVLSKSAQASVQGTALDFSQSSNPFSDLIDTVTNAAENFMAGNWKQALMTGNGAPYSAAFTVAESQNDLPPYLIARMAWQESHYRSDIINGGPNSAGAVGILQIIPSMHPQVNPSDPYASIAYVGQWMKQLYNQFGSWTLALMAYNWGPGNVNKWLKNGGNVPAETDAYYSDILSDVSDINGVTYT